MREIVLIVHNVRSSHNVGSLLRTADGLGIQQVYLTGYTPYPIQTNDDRMPHIARKVHQQISKTALGAEENVNWKHETNVETVVNQLKKDNFRIVALEQNRKSTPIPDYKPPDRVVLVVGREVEGLEAEILDTAHDIVEIPMFGKKESFNVVQAAAMALYVFRFSNP